MNRDKQNGLKVLSLSKGFTLIELLLAMGFVASLLIAITMTVIQLGNIYNRGITMKEVDQSGRSLSRELLRSISQSNTFSVVDGAGHYVIQTYGGRLCIGQYSFIWNYGKTLNAATPGSNINKYDTSHTPSTEQIRFIKVIDSNGYYCRPNATSEYPNIADSSMPTELLSSGNRKLAVHSFSISEVAEDLVTGQQLHSIEFQLGTNDQASIDNGKCKLPTESSKRDLTYCSVNNFSFLVRSGNLTE